MPPAPKYGNRVCFFIKDTNGMMWGIALTKLEARIQVAWFLPTENKYIIEPGVMPRNIPVKDKGKINE
jgi:hypothetical protein